MELPTAFKKRMKDMLGSDYEAFIASYSQPAARGLRINTLKTDVGAFLAGSGLCLEPSGIIDEGFVLGDYVAGIGNHPFHAAGLFYMQEPSAMSPIAEVGKVKGKRILDLCAAPGGKSGGIAQRMAGSGLLVSNEIVRSRAVLLSRTLERLGVTNSVVTSLSPDRLAELLPEYFDTVLVDAPCSGEGMFRKTPSAADEWSPEHVRSCAVRQGLILDSAARLVRPGGRIVYSTCTFSPEENENCVAAFLERSRNFELISQRRLYPHTSKGEGHFVAVLEMTDGKPAEKMRSPKMVGGRDGFARCREMAEFAKRTFAEPRIFDEAVSDDRGGVFLLTEEMRSILPLLNPVSMGVECGVIKKGRFEPSHTLFMASGIEAAEKLVFERYDERLKRFLRGETLETEYKKGYIPVCVSLSGQAHPLGFGKAVDNTLKNHLPKGLRIN